MSKYAFGVDVGGTTVKLGLFNDEGQVLDKWEIPTVKDNGGEKVLPDIAASIKNKMQEKNITAADLVGVGIGAPGAVMPKASWSTVLLISAGDLLILLKR